MPLSKFTKFVKGAQMLMAEQSIDNIQSASFNKYKESDRTKIIRNLNSMARRHLFTPLKDFKDVIATFAKQLKESGNG